MVDTTLDQSAALRLLPAAAARGRVRLWTLNNLRWLAIGGQSAALFIVYFAFGYQLPLIACGVACLRG